MKRSLKPNKPILNAFLYAFPLTLPICAGFVFVGMGYGMYSNLSGFSFIYPMLTSLLVFGGSLDFVTITMLLSPFAPLQVFLTALMVQSRHFFYGISMWEKYADAGWKKPYLIYTLCDETFSINCATNIPDNVDKNWFYFFVSILNQCYWVFGCTFGGLIGSKIPMNFEGLDFVMTALFVVIFVDHLQKSKNYVSALIGVACTVVCRLIFGARIFLIPSMICILVLLLLPRLIKKEVQK